MKTSIKYIVSATDSRGRKYYYAGRSLEWTQDRDRASRYWNKETAIRGLIPYSWQNIRIEEA